MELHDVRIGGKVKTINSKSLETFRGVVFKIIRISDNDITPFNINDITIVCHDYKQQMSKRASDDLYYFGLADIYSVITDINSIIENLDILEQKLKDNEKT